MWMKERQLGEEDYSRSKNVTDFTGYQLMSD